PPAGCPPDRRAGRPVCAARSRPSAPRAPSLRSREPPCRGSRRFFPLRLRWRPFRRSCGPSFAHPDCMIRTVTLLLFLATSAFAQDWKGLLEKTDRDLRAENYADARRTSIKLINSMMDNLNKGNRSMYTLAMTVAYRAVAEAGLQRYDEADWYWHVARSLYPNFNLAPYGEAGAWLRRRSDEQLETVDAPLTEIRQPVCLNRRDPKYPLGAILGSVAEPIVVRVLIDKDGTVRHPRLVNTTAAPTLVYAATEAVKKWQFQPASVDGKSCPMDFELTVNFQMGDQ